MAQVIDLLAYKIANHSKSTQTQTSALKRTVNQPNQQMAEEISSPICPSAVRQAEIHLHSAIVLLQDSPKFARVSWLLEECYELLATGSEFEQTELEADEVLIG